MHFPMKVRIRFNKTKNIFHYVGSKISNKPEENKALEKKYLRFSVDAKTGKFYTPNDTNTEKKKDYNPNDSQ
jgi:hypothetical protein